MKIAVNVFAPGRPAIQVHIPREGAGDVLFFCLSPVQAEELREQLRLSIEAYDAIVKKHNL